MTPYQLQLITNQNNIGKGVTDEYKMTLGKRILSVFLTVIMVFSMVPLPVVAAEADGAVNLKVSELSKEENYETLYSYYYDAVTGKRSFSQNDSIEFDGLDRTDTSASAKVYFEGKGIEIADNSTDYKAIPSEGEWLISNVSQASNSGEFVSCTAMLSLKYMWWKIRVILQGLRWEKQTAPAWLLLRFSKTMNWRTFTADWTSK